MRVYRMKSAATVMIQTLKSVTIWVSPNHTSFLFINYLSIELGSEGKHQEWCFSKRLYMLTKTVRIRILLSLVNYISSSFLMVILPRDNKYYLSREEIRICEMWWFHLLVVKTTNNIVKDFNSVELDDKINA